MEVSQNIPQHVAIIMDGNGRWAQQRGHDRIFGHANGVESVRQAIKSSLRHGVRYLTLYAFSTENWGRPHDEINALMELLCANIVNETPELFEQEVNVRTIGRRDRLSPEVIKHLAILDENKIENPKLTLVLALDYSSKWEITQAMASLAKEVGKGTLKSSDISPEMIDRHLYTWGIPDPDLIIRTSGEYRLSNFLLWQAAYCELYFTDVFWPDFNDSEFDKAIDSYKKRERRYGLVSPKAQH